MDVARKQTGLVIKIDNVLLVEVVGGRTWNSSLGVFILSSFENGPASVAVFIEGNDIELRPVSGIIPAHSLLVTVYERA